MPNHRRVAQLIASFVLVMGLAASPALAKTYLVNGLASAIPFIGYGMNNLGKKIPGAKVFSYVSGIEGNSIIKPNIIKDIKRRYAANPNEKINLVGISYGAGMVTQIAAELAKENIPVNYLGIIEGGRMSAVKSNVRRLDNFTCSGGDCSGRGARLAGGNSTTKVSNFRFEDFHIGMGDNSSVHKRIISQVR